jgi:hypothetical protein
VSTIEELLGRKSSGSGLEIREYGRRDPSRWPCGTICPQTLALTSPTSGGRSIGIVRSLTQATEFSFSYLDMRCVSKLCFLVCFAVISTLSFEEMWSIDLTCPHLWRDEPSLWPSEHTQIKLRPKVWMACCLLHGCFFPGFLFDIGDWGRMFFPKRRFGFTGLHGLVTQKIELFSW